MIQGKQRFFAIILLSSLTLNFFLGGILVGKYFGYFSEPTSFPHHPMRPKLHWMIQALPEESQTKIEPLIQEFHSKTQAQMQRVREARQAVHEQLTAQDFNRESLSKALAVLRQEMGNTQQQMHAQLVEIAGQLDEKERQQLSETTHRGSSWRRHRCGSSSEMQRPETP